VLTAARPRVAAGRPHPQPRLKLPAGGAQEVDRRDVGLVVIVIVLRVHGLY